MEKKLQPSEANVMNIVWDRGQCSARDIAAILAERVGWSKTTTYTVIKKCLDKGILRRIEPGFLCEAVLSRREVQTAETNELIDRYFGGSTDALVSALLGSERLTREEIERLRRLIGETK